MWDDISIGFDSHFPFYNLPDGHLYVFFEKYLLMFFADFLTGYICVCVCVSRCLSALYILDNNSLLDTCFINIFSHFSGCLFILMVISFAMQKLISLTQSHLLLSVLLGSHSKKSLPWPMSTRLFCMFASGNFTVSSLKV